MTTQTPSKETVKVETPPAVPAAQAPAAPAVKESYTRAEMDVLLKQARSESATSVQQVKDKEVAQAKARSEELEAITGYSQLSDAEKAQASNLTRVKTANVQGLIANGVVPETARRRLMLQPTIDDFWAEVDSIKVERGTTTALAVDPLLQARTQTLTAADHNLDLPNGSMAPEAETDQDVVNKLANPKYQPTRDEIKRARAAQSKGIYPNFKRA